MSIADTNAGLHALVGVLAALHASKTTGHGTYLDIAMYDTMLATDDYLHHAVDRSPVERLGGEYYQLPSGRWILVSGQFKHVWNQVAAKGGRLTDPTPKGADLATKIAMRREAFASWFAGFPNDDDATTALTAVKLEWGIVASPEDAVRAPTAVHRNMVAQVDDHGGGKRGVINSPYRFSNYESGVRGGGRLRGEDNANVLHEWLGSDDATISALTNSGVLQAQ
jgi:crotonobetainyl-CoA:carnitine CoA-transferase CaiB-like acyl-CoA transferase